MTKLWKAPATSETEEEKPGRAFHAEDLLRVGGGTKVDRWGARKRHGGEAAAREGTGVSSGSVPWAAMEGSHTRGTLWSMCIFEEIILSALMTDLESSREEPGSPFGVLVKIIVIRTNLSANFS